MATPKQILRIQELKVLAENAYQEFHDEVQKVFDKEGEISDSVEIEPTEEGHKWLRVTLTDNSAKLKRGEQVVGISLVRPVGCKIDMLKNKPKE